MKAARPVISPALVRDICARASLHSLVARDVTLRRCGRDWWACCPFHQEKTASFTLSHLRNSFRCYGCGARGDVIDWVMRRERLSFMDAVQRLAAELGLVTGLAASGERRSLPSPPPSLPLPEKAPDGPDPDQMRRIERARSLYAGARPGHATLVDVYLRSRGIVFPPPPTLRFVSTLYHGPSRQSFPAMLAPVQDRAGHVTGIHRTWLAADGSGKAPVQPAKMMAGRCADGAVRLAPAANELCLAEGIETALSVMQATGKPCWAALSLGGLAGDCLSDGVRTVTLCADSDARDPDAAEAQLQRAAAAHARRGIKVRIARATPGRDFNDMLRGGA